MPFPCPLCNSSEVHTFSHYTWDNGIQETVKVMCADCQCEAPLDKWNLRSKCVECGLPIPICNALAMYKKSVGSVSRGRLKEAARYAASADEFYQNYLKRTASPAH